jgi:hypothetical protein
LVRRKVISAKGFDRISSSAAIHPRKHVAVTVSDDRSWKMWAIPEGRINSILEYEFIVIIFR